MTTTDDATDPVITIVGLEQRIKSLLASLREANSGRAEASANDAASRAYNAQLRTERDALAAALATCTAERDEAVAALAHAAAKHGEELARVTAQRDQASAQVDRIEAIVNRLPPIDRTMDTADNLRRAIEHLTSERDSALADIRACEARVKRVESESNKATAEAAELRQRVADLEARPVLTEERLAEALTSIVYGIDARRKAAAVTMANLGPGPVTLPAQAAPTTPPGEVFAGVSKEELGTEYWRGVGVRSTTLGCERDTIAGISAVLARLKVSLVAPVDRRAIERAVKAYHDAPGGHADQASDLGSSSWRAAVLAMAAAFTAAGVPVTPERGQ